MKKYLFCLAIAAMLPLSQSQPANAGVSVGINIGPPVVVAAPPSFIMPPQLGFYVATGVPYDFYYFEGRYYQPRGNVWYSAPYYNGPWGVVPLNRVPYGLRKYSPDRVHYYRDSYYGSYRANPRGDFRHFRPAERRGDVRGDHGRRNGWDRGEHGRGHGR